LSAATSEGLAVFRICFEVLLAVESWGYLLSGAVKRNFVDPEFLFGFFSFLPRWSGNGMYWHFAAQGILALMIALGLFYRASAALFCVGFTYVFLLDEALYLNHFYLICLMSFLLNINARTVFDPRFTPMCSLH